MSLHSFTARAYAQLFHKHAPAVLPEAVYTGTPDDDSISGSSSADTIDGGAGDDTLRGNGGNDSIVGSDGRDSIVGGTGNDSLYGGSWLDAIFGGDGNDLLDAGEDGASMYGEAGNDRLVGGVDIDTLSGGDGADNLNGGSGSDLLWGDAGSDTMLGGAGNDHLSQEEGDGVDTINGGSGLDQLAADWGSATSDIVWVNNPALTQTVNGNSITGIEALAVNLGSGNDTLTNLVGSGEDAIDGGAGNDSVSGGGGADALSGGSGKDTITGGAGTDVLSGGTEADLFRMDSLSGSDQFGDFTSGTDKMSFVQSTLPVGDGDALVEGALKVGSPGGFSASAELVIHTNNILGAITTTSAAKAIGNASTAYTVGQTAIFVVDNGLGSAVFYFKSSGTNGTVSASELTLLGNLLGEPSTSTGDFLFGS